MRKIIVGVVLAGLLSFTAYAEDGRTYTEFQMYTGTINLCEGDMGRLLLFDIEPVDVGRGSLVVGDRVEVATNNLLYDGAGVRISPEQCNERYLDRRVSFVAGRNGYGVKVLWVRMK